MHDGPVPASLELLAVSRIGLDGRQVLSWNMGLGIAGFDWALRSAGRPDTPRMALATLATWSLVGLMMS